MLVVAAGLERSAEDNQGHRRRRRGELADWLEDDLWQRDAEDEEERAEDGTEDHRVLEHAQEDAGQVEVTAAEGLEDEDGDDVVDRHDDGNHHRRDGQLVVAEDIADDWDAHDDEVAAEDGLDHRPAPLVRLLDEADDDAADQRRGEHADSAEQHEMRPERLGEVGRVDVIEHHEEEEDLEDHAVDMGELELREQAHLLDGKADEHQEKQRDDCADCDNQVTDHNDSTFHDVFSIAQKKPLLKAVVWDLSLT